jgi:RNA polymerase sigma-70 factor, ECF subfamily
MKHSQPEDIVVSKLEYDRLLKAMDSLDIRHRSVLALRYFNDLSYQEIAEVLEIPLGTVKSRLNQSLRYLKQQLNPAETEA